MHDPTDVVENALAVAEQSKRERQDRAADGALLRRILSSDYGRTFVMSLIERAGVFQISLSAGNPDITAFNEGRRNEGLHLYTQIIEHCPEYWQTMIRERAERLVARKDLDS